VAAIVSSKEVDNGFFEEEKDVAAAVVCSGSKKVEATQELSQTNIGYVAGTVPPSQAGHHSNHRHGLQAFIINIC